MLGQLTACAAVQRTYGKQADDIKAVAKIFLADLAGYSAQQISDAMQKWRKQAQEFPTPADIIALLDKKPKLDGNVYGELLNKQKRGEIIGFSESEYMRKYKQAVLNNEI